MDRNCRLAGMLRIGADGDSDDVLFCGDVIVAEWAQDEIGGGNRVHAHVWDTRYMSPSEADKRTRENPNNRFISLRYWISDRPETDDAIKVRAIEEIYGVGDIAWGARYSEITGYLWTDEDFNVGSHDMIARLTSDVGKYLLLEMTVHSGPKSDVPASYYVRK